MSNHFHLLLEVPDRDTLAPLDEEGLLAVLPLLYEGHVVEGVKQELERARAAGDERWHREILSRYERRRGADWGDLRVLRDLQKDVMGT